MSQEEISNGDTTTANGETQDNTESVKSPEAVLKKNRELLAKLKTEQEKSRELESKWQQAEEDRLAKEGKKDELIQNLKSKLTENESKLKTVTQTFALKTVNEQVKDAARAMGAEKPELVMKLADLSTVTVSDDFSVDSAALKSALESVKQEAPELFKKTPTPPRDGVPRTGDTSQKPLSGMSIAELQALYSKQGLKQ